MRALILAAALGAAALGTGAAARAGGNAEEIDPGSARFARFLFLATLEGAMEDALPPAALEAALETDAEGRYRHFVYACPVCAPVLEGLRAYGMRERFYFSRKGDPYVGDPKESPVAAIAGRLAGTDRKERGAALHDLVQRWVARRMEERRLSPEERAEWRRAMEIGRKKGMGLLPRSEGFEHPACPSCDGAAGLPFGER